MKRFIPLALCAFILTACNGPVPQDDFVENLMPLCGQSYAGKVVSTDAVDTDWRAQSIIAGPIVCEVAAIKMPLAVGENTSRTWVIIPEKRTLTLKHDHRHKDGTPDAVSWYGGTSMGTDTSGTALRQEFPVDDFSIKLFETEGLPASVTNTWAMDIKLGETFAYELSRPPTAEQSAAGEAGRFFRLEFDLTQPLEAAPKK